MHPRVQTKSIFKIGFLFSVLFFSSVFIFADGTKQASPTNSVDGASLCVLPDIATGSYFGCPNQQRIRFTVLNHTVENLYLGFQPRSYNNAASVL